MTTSERSRFALDPAVAALIVGACSSGGSSARRAPRPDHPRQCSGGGATAPGVRAAEKGWDIGRVHPDRLERQRAANTSSFKDRDPARRRSRHTAPGTAGPDSPRSTSSAGIRRRDHPRGARRDRLRRRPQGKPRRPAGRRPRDRPDADRPLRRYIGSDLSEGQKAAAAMCGLLSASAKKNVVRISGGVGASATSTGPRASARR